MADEEDTYKESERIDIVIDELVLEEEVDEQEDMSKYEEKLIYEGNVINDNFVDDENIYAESIQLPEWGSIIDIGDSNVPASAYTSARSKYSSDRIACFHCQHSGGSILAGRPGSHSLQPATCQRCHRVCGRVFGLHPYVQRDFSGNTIKLCNRCLDQWIRHREQATSKGMRLFDDERNEEICSMCSDCPEADLILCSSCPRSYCVNCLTKVLTTEEYLEMMRAEDWVCFVCVGNESKDVRCMFIENKDLDRLEKEEEYLVERAKNEQKRMRQALAKLNDLIGPNKRPPRLKPKGADKKGKSSGKTVPDKITQREFLNDEILISMEKGTGLGWDGTEGDTTHQRDGSDDVISSPHNKNKRKQVYHPKNLDDNMVAIRTGKRGRPRLVTREEAKTYDIGVTAPTSHYAQHKSQREKEKKKSVGTSREERQQQQSHVVTYQPPMIADESGYQSNNFGVNSGMSHHQSSVQPHVIGINNNFQYTLLCDHFQYYRACPECKIDSSGYKYYDVPALKNKIAKVQNKIEKMSRKLSERKGEIFYSDYVQFKRLGLHISDVDTYREPEDVTSDDEEEDSDDEEGDSDDEEKNGSSLQ